MSPNGWMNFPGHNTHFIELKYSQCNIYLHESNFKTPILHVSGDHPNGVKSGKV
jgi:hypothetical protein